MSEVVLHFHHSDTQHTAPCVACRCSKHPSTAKDTLLCWLYPPMAPNRDRPMVAIAQCISSPLYPESWDRGLTNSCDPPLQDRLSTRSKSACSCLCHHGTPNLCFSSNSYWFVCYLQILAIVSSKQNPSRTEASPWS